MPHPFKDKLFIFIGNPLRCSRQAARDALIDAGGVIDERITTFTHYIVAFDGAERTKVYGKAVERDERGYVVLLNEEQFFNILDGKAEPPAKKKPPLPEGVIVFPAINPEDNAAEHERAADYFLVKKRMVNEMRQTDSITNFRGINAGASPSTAALQLKSFIKSKLEQQAPYSIMPFDSDYCSICGQPARVHIGDNRGNDIAHLCFGCHNRLMAEITGADMPDNIPKRLSYKGRNGKRHEFEIEFHIFANGKYLQATELGKTKRKADVHGEFDENFNVMLETLERRIKKMLAASYIQKEGYLKGCFIEDKAVGYIAYNRERDACDIIIDGKPYTWAELEKNVAMREGWKIKIEFGDIGDELD